MLTVVNILHANPNARQRLLGLVLRHGVYLRGNADVGRRVGVEGGRDDGEGAIGFRRDGLEETL